MVELKHLHPKITVIMPVFNGEKYIQTAIDSILNQTFTDFELIVIDDCSCDKSLEIIKSYNDNRIKLLENNTNLGVTKTKNKGIEKSLGEYIAFLDCDDYAYPSRLAEQLEFMESNPDFGMIGSWVEVMDENGVLTGEVWKYVEPAQKIPSILLFHNYFAQSAVFLRKSVLCDEWYRRQRAEDYDLWVRIARKSKVGNIQKVLIKYRLHPSSRSQKAVHAIETNVVDIVSEQINYLGITPTSEELALHRQLGAYNYNDINLSLKFIQESAEWLTKLRNANSQVNIYQNNDFNQVLADIQLAVFCKCLENQEIQVTTKQWELEQKQYQIQATQNELEECKHWIKELQEGKDWLESQYYIWIKVAKDKQTEIEQYQTQLQYLKLELENLQLKLQKFQN
ncbi:glycosyl transferase [Nostoc sp. PCC 7524]|uniref:glycosyltransferase family 2 protein n=1 Tax=Nostoc sp. (strain ATCC 29411 / PCC 7524) TaxID=28072 RepID=UPI00029F32D4|nr:glycosyltransferase [Nostoc sp. PCC 7524]AFY48356.1 glycosyl transferase [Nostoc sp. PCC 7524]